MWWGYKLLARKMDLCDKKETEHAHLAECRPKSFIAMVELPAPLKLTKKVWPTAVLPLSVLTLCVLVLGMAFLGRDGSAS